MAIKFDNIIISEDDSLQDIRGFSKVVAVITSLYKSGMIERMSGNCIGATDIVGNMLYQKGIKSYVTECQVTIDNPESGTVLIGYDNFLSEGETSQVDTHTVLIVVLEDAQLLLDMSIMYALPPSRPIILEKINGSAPDIIAEYKFFDFNIVYNSKKTTKLPHLHQMNLVSNIIAERKNDKKIETLKTFIFISIALGVVNMTINLLLTYLKLFPVF
jgi:hypothetical protein